MRPDWDTYFMTVAKVVSLRSTCLRRQVGACLTRDNRILATGYNGAPSGLKHCLEIGCLREEKGIPSGERHELCRGLHAEQNALLQAAVYGVSIAGATLYTTHFPCALCAKMLIQARIERVVYLEFYPDPFAEELFREAGVKLEPFRGKLCFPGERGEDGAEA
ncbi:CMP/dCMP deaminase zinc-binding protein [Ammonifex degensii KC4]|uniref:CMP/dCMP deaminase zinc-binding protein n=1 Tax=Ammonifex degensii (strain DSM 10501 / KC4) TaxID=429009 RepID=C9RAD9_AMMDK|nr:cytidine/deoxycytidylate deaminase family protein [Ammonifex degensii]ACX51248.1 CMP/dCMP deaminase zinc-binding protein [Ammonifex degensii KC4]